MNKKSIIFLVIIGVLIIIQFINTRSDIPDWNPSDDFLVMHQPNGAVKNILTSTCYDCHSYESEFPWYESIAPVSWWINNHINEGREHLNFSTWAKYDDEEKAHKLEELVEEVEEKEMPLKSYTWIHKDARLTAEQRNKLISWVENSLTASLPASTHGYEEDHED